MFINFPHEYQKETPFSAPPYVFTNEKGAIEAIETLSQLPKRPGKRLHMGVSGFFNYDIAAARRSDGIILWDINCRVQKLHKLVQSTLSISSTRKEFISKLIQTAEAFPYKTFFQGRSTNSLQNIREESFKKPCWLAQESTYQHIRSLYQKDCVQISLGNWLDNQMVARIARWLRKNSLILDTVYLSNCGDLNWILIAHSFLETSRLTLHSHFSLKDRITPLVQTGSYVIEASASEDLNQKIYKIQKLGSKKLVSYPIFIYQPPLKQASLLRVSRHSNQTAFCLFLISAILLYKWLQMTTNESGN